MDIPMKAPRRGRPPKISRSDPDTRRALIRCGVELLTEQGFNTTGIEQVLKRVSVPKGSFYHYFDSKDAFGREVLAEYGKFFERRLRRILLNSHREPLDRIQDLLQESLIGMEKYNWRRGCLVGNLGQEVTLLPDDFRDQIEKIFRVWEALLSQCLQEAQANQSIAQSVECEQLAAFFWIGWEGAITRARLCESGHPLSIFVRGFLAGIAR